MLLRIEAFSLENTLLIGHKVIKGIQLHITVQYFFLSWLLGYVYTCLKVKRSFLLCGPVTVLTLAASSAMSVPALSSASFIYVTVQQHSDILYHPVQCRKIYTYCIFPQLIASSVLMLCKWHIALFPFCFSTFYSKVLKLHFIQLHHNWLRSGVMHYSTLHWKSRACPNFFSAHATAPQWCELNS